MLGWLIVDRVVDVEHSTNVDFGRFTEGDDDVGFVGRCDETRRSRDKGVSGRSRVGRHQCS
eukprot:scaffold213148_cov68-Cyclotella_meneghiniana.AAC.1